MKKSIIIASFLLIGAGCSQAVSVPVDNPPTNTESDLSELTVPTPTEIVEEDSAMDKEESPVTTDIMEKKTWAFPGTLPESDISNKQVRIMTPKGEIVFELFNDEAPATVSNFVYLTNGGYFDGLTFHRREEDFVIQGGDPNGNGTGGPGYRFPDEPVTRRYDRGIVAMANAGPDTNGSQFFIMLADTSLPPSYTIFGRVVSGIETIDSILPGDAMTKVTVEEKK